MNLDVAASIRGPEVAPSLGPDLASPASEAPSVFSALGKQLGLKLTTGRAEVSVLVIDRLERPREN
jgi:uncharacterized protein (TIGR03435 family)